MSMTANEARAEIKSLFEKASEIERRYEGEITNNEDETEVKRLLAEVDGLEDKLAGLNESEERKRRIVEGQDRYSRPAVVHPQASGDPNAVQLSPGDQFIRSQEYRHIKGSGRFESQLHRNEFSVTLGSGTSLISWQKALEGKALVYSGTGVAGAMVQNDVQAGVLSILQRQINVLDLIPRLQTDSDTIEYVREDTFTNSAAMTAEATATTGTSGTKPESVLAYSSQTSAVRTLAHWIPVTNKTLSDAPQIRGIINSRLLLGLTLVLETQILTGAGTGEEFTGILNAGINIQSLGTDSVQDAIFKGRTLVRVTGKAMPSAVVLHPNDWQAVRLARENASTATLGGYLMGPPSMTGATTLWGLPVVESEAITENTGLVGDFGMGCSLFDREQAAVRVGFINDQFTRNMQTILAELRAAFVVWRPTAFTRITGI
jgi:HK97 family phage major capsid protein